jgi:hypothetical protein
VQLHRGGPVDGGGDGLLQGTGTNTGAGAGGRVGREIRGGAAGSSGKAARSSGKAAGSTKEAKLGFPIAAVAQLRRCRLLELCEYCALVGYVWTWSCISGRV